MHRRQLTEFALRAEVQAPIDILRSATIVAARLFRMQDQIGQVAEGFRADLIMVDGDVLHDVAAWATPETSIRLVMKDGAVMVAR